MTCQQHKVTKCHGLDFFFQIRPQDNFFFEIVNFGASTFNPKCSPVANLSLTYTQTLDVRRFLMLLVYYCTIQSTNPSSTNLHIYLSFKSYSEIYVGKQYILSNQKFSSIYNQSIEKIST